ncbi:uncharacterized protein [Nerophis lumbriciformis]|uniref:uncharacterized protein n=1 Tax=Nerophis lumbriciformis TaxID=546530 RepID=UPI002ADFF750|nr:uncharacterized protein LOC133571799 [Nerophis lumbriciformis]
MAVLFGVLCLLVSTCLGFPSQSASNGRSLKGEDSNHGYVRLLDPRTLNQFDSGAPLDADRDVGGPNVGMPDKWRHSPEREAVQNQIEEKEPHSQHPLDLLIKQHTPDTSVEGISFPHIGHFKRLVESMKNSFLTPGKDLMHFQTAGELLLNEIASGLAMKPTDGSVDHEDNDVLEGPNQKGVGLSPRMQNTEHGKRYPGQKLHPFWSKDRKLPDQTSLSSPNVHSAANASSTKVHSHLSQQNTPSLGSYSKSVNVKPQREPVASWVYMPDGRQKTTGVPVTAKESGVAEVSPVVGQPARGHGWNVQASKTQDPRNGRFQSEKRKPSIYGSSTHKGILRDHSPRPDSSKNLAQETQKPQPNVPQRFGPVQQVGSPSASRKTVPVGKPSGGVGKPSGGVGKPSGGVGKPSGGVIAAPQGAQATTRRTLLNSKRTYQLPLPQWPMVGFQRKLSVFLDPKKKSVHRSRSSYVRSQVTHSSSRYSPH